MTVIPQSVDSHMVCQHVAVMEGAQIQISVNVTRAGLETSAAVPNALLMNQPVLIVMGTRVSVCIQISATAMADLVKTVELDNVVLGRLKDSHVLAMVLAV